jgi:DNA polymerase-3 subunit delta
MQITAPELKQHTKKLAQVYLITGDENLLVRNAQEHIRARAEELGFSTKQSLYVESGFHWKTLHNALHNQNLFSEKTLIELHHPQAKFDDEAKSILLHYLSKPNPDTMLIILCEKLTAAQKKAAWFQAIDKAGVIISIWPISPRDFPRWIHEKFQEKKLKATPEAIHLLAKLTEGHLLATAQVIEKLSLLYDHVTISEKEIMSASGDSARFSIFDLTQYALAGDATRVARIIQGLEQEDAEPTLVLWSLTKEIRLLCEYSAKIERGESPQNVLRREWANRKPLFQQTLRRYKEADFLKLLHRASQVDFMIKGIAEGNVWNALMDLSVNLAGKQI